VASGDRPSRDTIPLKYLYWSYFKIRCTVILPKYFIKIFWRNILFTVLQYCMTTNFHLPQTTTVHSRWLFWQWSWFLCRITTNSEDSSRYPESKAHDINIILGCVINSKVSRNFDLLLLVSLDSLTLSTPSLLNPFFF
jgi:hypothetical protein